MLPHDRAALLAVTLTFACSNPSAHTPAESPEPASIEHAGPAPIEHAEPAPIEHAEPSAPGPGAACDRNLRCCRAWEAAITVRTEDERKLCGQAEALARAANEPGTLSVVGRSCDLARELLREDLERRGLPIPEACAGPNLADASEDPER